MKPFLSFSHSCGLPTHILSHKSFSVCPCVQIQTIIDRHIPSLSLKISTITIPLSLMIPYLLRRWPSCWFLPASPPPPSPSACPGGHRTQDWLRGQWQRPEATHGTEGAAAGVAGHHGWLGSLMVNCMVKKGQ